MAKPTTSQEPASPRVAFTFYAANGRVYASNVKQKLIDLGALTQQGDTYRYVLDGNQQAGEGFPSAEAALRHIADNTRFLFLDGQFTALADLRANGGAGAGAQASDLHLDDAARIDVMVDELKSGERIEDSTV